MLSEVFCKDMGYIENLLPKYLARMGAEVHLVTTDLPPYFRQREASEAYKNHSEQLQPGTVEARDGYTVHVLAHERVLGYMRMVGLREKLRLIQPDIVQTTAAVGWIPLDAALSQPLLGYRLFTGCHMTASVFPLANQGQGLPWWDRERLLCTLRRAFPGRLVSLFTQKCYAATEDCAFIASGYLGVQSSKVQIMYLGVDTECFFPVNSPATRQERLKLRRQLGFAERDLVCIYTGKLTVDKNVVLLAKAIEQLRSGGLRFRGLFVGNGPEGEKLRQYPASVILGFVPFSELAPYYRAADIGVWPGTESISMLDAAACALPIVMSDQVFYRAPVEGNGKVFAKDNIVDLKRALFDLHEFQVRQALGLRGAARMASDFSWECVAKRRLQAYQAALRSKGWLGTRSKGREDHLSDATLNQLGNSSSTTSRS